MRIKILVIGAGLAALVGGGSASAALQNKLNVDVLQKAQGKPAVVKVYAENYDSANKIPERVSEVILKSKSAKWNGKAVPKCTSPIPDINLASAAISPPCPKSSQVGTGTATVYAGNAGDPVPELGGINWLDAKLRIYNYKASAGDKVTLLLEAISQKPVEDATAYSLIHIDSKGTLKAAVPSPATIPTNLAQAYPGKNFHIVKFQTTLNSKRTKFFMLKKGNLNAELTVTRE